MLLISVYMKRTQISDCKKNIKFIVSLVVRPSDLETFIFSFKSFTKIKYCTVHSASLHLFPRTRFQTNVCFVTPNRVSFLRSNFYCKCNLRLIKMKVRNLLHCDYLQAGINIRKTPKSAKAGYLTEKIATLLEIRISVNGL